MNQISVFLNSFRASPYILVCSSCYVCITLYFHSIHSFQSFQGKLPAYSILVMQLQHSLCKALQCVMHELYLLSKMSQHYDSVKEKQPHLSPPLCLLHERYFLALETAK